MCEPLKDKEITALRKLIPHIEEIERQAEYRSSVRLVFSTWRGSVIFYGGLVAGFITFKDQIVGMLKSMLGIG